MFFLPYKIINLPKSARLAMKDVIKSDGTVRNIKEAVAALSDYLILSEEPATVYDISEYVAADGIVSAKDIAKKAFSLLSEEGKFSCDRRRAMLMQSLYDCLKITDVLNFEGFVNFRTESYIRLLYSAVFTAAEDCIAEREYREMTSLLRDAVKNSDSIIKEAHIYGSFIFDETGNEINREGKIYLLKPDKMLATLLSFCPERIYIHYPPDKGIMSAIEAVFAPNIIYIN